MEFNHLYIFASFCIFVLCGYLRINSSEFNGVTNNLLYNFSSETKLISVYKFKKIKIYITNMTKLVFCESTFIPIWLKLFIHGIMY